MLGVRPEHVAAGDAAASIAVLARGRDRDRRADGGHTLVWTKLGKSNFGFLVESATALRVGERAMIGFDPDRASLFDEASGDRL